MTATLLASFIKTPMGTMLAIADSQALLLLQFIEAESQESALQAIERQLDRAIIVEENEILTLIRQELQCYFAGTLTRFTTPVALQGTAFQRSVWHTLQEIPYGQIKSYKEIAHSLNNPRACRAVGRANGANRLAIIIPCHRVINQDGSLSGYNSGVDRKQWLIEHEKSTIFNS